MVKNNTNNNNPQFLLFAQHGWADTGKVIGKLAQTTASSYTNSLGNSFIEISSPSLGLVQTMIRIDPLVAKLEQIVTKAISKHPDVPIKIMGHSMGGLMWLEVLNRNPQWWPKVHSLILLGSPVGGSNIARIIDPLGIGIGTARDLGKDRRGMAESIAQQIPTLSIASDIGMGSDGLVKVENTKFDYANLLLISGIRHDAMRYHPQMIPLIQNFWAYPQLGLPPIPNFPDQLIQLLRSLPGMTDTDYRNFERSQVVATFADNITLHVGKNSLGLNHVFVGKDDLVPGKYTTKGKIDCLYAGYVGLLHNLELRQFIREICQQAI